MKRLKKHHISYFHGYLTPSLSPDFSKQVKQKVGTPYLLVTSLEEEVTYEFNVKAQTIDYGPEVSLKDRAFVFCTVRDIL